MKLEVVVIPVSDVDRAKKFYKALGHLRHRSHLRALLGDDRVVGPADVAALGVHIMINTALTGATYDIDGGQQLLSGA